MRRIMAGLAALAVMLAAAVWVLGMTAGKKPQAAAASGKIDNRTDVLLVNADNPLPEDFVPRDLVNLYEQKRHFLLARSDIYLEREAFEAANRMFEQAEKEDMNGFILTSGYRSREKQAELYAARTDNTAQAPGCSEHETGLAFDVTARYDSGSFSDTPQYAWLMDHCWDFGFILRYPEGKEAITGIAAESWHFRYVGKAAALTMRERGWTLEEYCLYGTENSEQQ